MKFENGGPGNSARVEAYLDQVLAPLMRQLSPFHRDELRREMRAHLWGRVDAYQELGQSEDDAVTEALRQFGGAEDFLRQWRHEWKGAVPQTSLLDFQQAIRLALPFTLSALFIVSLPLLLAYYQPSADRNGPSGWIYDHYTAFNHAWLGLCFLLPVGLGSLVGQCAGKSAALGTVGALTLVGLFGCLISFAGSYLWEQEVSIREMVNQIAWLGALWMPIACTTAGITQRWARKRRKTSA